MAGPALPLQLQGHGRQRQEAVLPVEVAGTHRQLCRQERIADLDGLEAGQFQLPATGREPPQRQDGPSLPNLPHLKPLQLAYVVADQVGAWRPAGQGENQPALSWPMADPDPHQVLVAGGEIEIQIRHGRAPGGAGLRCSCSLVSRRRGWRLAAGPSQLRSGG